MESNVEEKIANILMMVSSVESGVKANTHSITWCDYLYLFKAMLLAS